jgi:hypothetical protein
MKGEPGRTCAERGKRETKPSDAAKAFRHPGEGRDLNIA